MSGLEKARRARGLTRADLGRLVFRCDETVARWERHQTRMPKAVMLHLASVLAVPVEALVD